MEKAQIVTLSIINYSIYDLDVTANNQIIESAKKAHYMLIYESTYNQIDPTLFNSSPFIAQRVALSSCSDFSFTSSSRQYHFYI